MSPEFDALSDPETDDGIPSESKTETRLAGAADEVAFVLAALVPDLSERTAIDLRRLLAHSLTVPEASELREARLGLLIDLVSDGSGQIPGVNDYNQARGARQERGEQWPAHTTLVRAYGGHWLAAVRAAMRVAFEGSQARVSADPGHHRPRPAYSRNEVAQAIATCWNDLGLSFWGRGPSFAEYVEWARLWRRSRRLAGLPDPRIPGRKSVLRNWGSWERARDAAACLWSVLSSPARRP